MSLATGTILQNRYRIVKLIGQGGFGAVYRGWDLSLEQLVAVKENLGKTAEARRQFEHEAKLLARLRHPNLPRVGDHFVLPGQGQYLVMDFVEGQSLAALLAARGGPLAEAEALPWMRQVCDALTYLHGRTPPIIHRDIKPENIIITAEGRAMLVDFGISKVYDPSKGTTIGAKAVTPGYSPPEQYGRGRTDGRSDVYSLGATLYTLLTGHVPPEAPDLSSGADVLTPPRAVNPAVSEATSAAIVAAMALSMSQRLADAGSFKRLLPVIVPPLLPTQSPTIPPPAVRRSPSRLPWSRHPKLGGTPPLPKTAAVSAKWKRIPPSLRGLLVLIALAFLVLGGIGVCAWVNTIYIFNLEGIAVDSEGSIYVVTDWNSNRVQKYTATGILLAEWGGEGRDVGQFIVPTDIDVDDDGNIYVTDSNNHRIQKFTANGTFVEQWGSRGSRQGEFIFPLSMDVGDDGNVYVVDFENYRIQKFTADGIFLDTWGSQGSDPGQFILPMGIAVDAGGNVYVVDSLNSRIQRFTSDGVLINAWGSEGSGAGQFSGPSGIAVASDGTVYVVDSGNHRIQLFTPDGEFIASWGRAD